MENDYFNNFQKKALKKVSNYSNTLKTTRRGGVNLAYNFDFKYFSD